MPNVRGYCILIVVLAGSFVPALGAGAPEPPVGYESNELLMKDFASGKVAVIRPYEAMPAGVVEHKDIEYGRVGDRRLLLDMYAPADLAGPAPGLIFIHGGGWRSGKKEDYQYHCVEMAKRGYVAATIGYRLSGEAAFPAAVQDAQCAVRWMRAHAGDYHVDPTRIAVLGGSAGGHLALMVGYAEAGDFPKTGGHEATRGDVQAVVNLYGVTDSTTERAQTAPEVTSFLGKSYADAPELYSQNSPIAYLDAADPPTLTFHGTIDEVVPVAQADALAAKLDALGVAQAYHRLDGWPHTMDIAQPVNAYVLWHIDAFLNEHLAERE
jgi:acetyl esterase/lipase